LPKECNTDGQHKKNQLYKTNIKALIRIVRLLRSAVTSSIYWTHCPFRIKIGLSSHKWKSINIYRTVIDRAPRGQSLRIGIDEFHRPQWKRQLMYRKSGHSLTAAFGRVEWPKWVQAV